MSGKKKKISASGPQNPLRGKLTFGLDRQKNFFKLLLFDSCRAFKILKFVFESLDLVWGNWNIFSEKLTFSKNVNFSG